VTHSNSVFPHLGPVVSTSTLNSSDKSSKRNGTHFWLGRAFPRLSVGLGVLLLVLAYGVLRSTPASASVTPALKLSTTTLSFGSAAVDSEVTRTVTLTASSGSAVTVKSASITGAGFTLVAGTFPTTLNPNQSLTLELQLRPTEAGSATGKLSIDSSTATSGNIAVVSLSGTGTGGSPELKVSATALSFGSVDVNSAAKDSITLTSSSTSAVTVSSASISGADFTIVGGSFPLTLNPNQSSTLQIQFKPTAAGSDTGQLTIDSNSNSGAKAVVALSGSGTAATARVDLTWDAPSSSAVPVEGYDVYRSTGTGAFQLLNSSVNAQTSYVDSTAVSGTTYNYTVKSVDNSGVQSVASNQITVAVP
jgi:Abnormal spindle-like microcephaly-assoc'd, ASPM-SPD-2-Hydin